jgi:hypothetical protein
MYVDNCVPGIDLWPKIIFLCAKKSFKYPALMIRLSSDEEKILAEEEDLYSDSYEQVSLTWTVTAMSRSI